MWTKVPKPTRTPVSGSPIAAGFFLFLTYTTGAGGWVDIPKPTQQAWTDVPKPTGATDVEIHAGEPIGLLLALTYAEDSSFTTDPWTKVPKPTT